MNTSEERRSHGRPSVSSPAAIVSAPSTTRVACSRCAGSLSNLMFPQPCTARRAVCSSPSRPLLALSRLPHLHHVVLGFSAMDRGSLPSCTCAQRSWLASRCRATRPHDRRGRWFVRDLLGNPTSNRQKCATTARRAKITNLWLFCPLEFKSGG